MVILSEIKTLNGYSFVDTKAREDIAALAEELDNGTGGSSVDQVQADWNENDPASKAYIQNRTHWAKGETKEVYPEAEAVYIGDGTYIVPVLYASEPKPGDIVSMAFNGATYKTNIVELVDGDMAVAVFGDPSVVGIPVAGNEALPFFGYFLPPEAFEADGASAMFYLIENGTPVVDERAVSLSAYIDAETVHKIDEKYLPIQKTHWVNEEVVEIIPETEYSLQSQGMVNAEIANPPIADVDYRVTINGQSYDTTAYLLGGNTFAGMLALGNTKTFEGGIETDDPFTIIFLPAAYQVQFNATLLTVGLDTTGTLSIIEPVGSVHRLNVKYLPKSLAAAANFTNLQNGSAAGSVRSPNAEEEIGKRAFAFGFSAKASGEYSIAFGEISEASNEGAVAIGYGTEATGNGSIALGDHATAGGDGSVALKGMAEGEGSVAGPFGYADGRRSFAMAGANANADYSVAFGDGIEARGENSFVYGRWNIPDSENKYAHIVGNGTGEYIQEEENVDRSNAHTLDWEGNAWFAGTIEGTAMILKSPNGSRFKITVGDDGVLNTEKL